jgi:peptide/nickel transport system ATP-binding protein
VNPRAAVARALALEPELIVADEPTSALDVSVRAQVLNLLVDLRARLGLGMVFISHDVQTVRYLADRIAVLYLGRVVEEGGAAQVTGASSHPYTEALLSATPSLLERPERIVLHGPVPSATNPPSGCPFRTRCWKADDTCATVLPAAAGEGGHRWHCVHPQPGDGAAVGASRPGGRGPLRRGLTPRGAAPIPTGWDGAVPPGPRQRCGRRPGGPLTRRPADAPRGPLTFRVRLTPGPLTDRQAPHGSRHRRGP